MACDDRFDYTNNASLFPVSFASFMFFVFFGGGVKQKNPTVSLEIFGLIFGHSIDVSASPCSPDEFKRKMAQIYMYCIQVYAT